MTQWDVDSASLLLIVSTILENKHVQSQFNDQTVVISAMHEKAALAAIAIERRLFNTQDEKDPEVQALIIHQSLWCCLPLAIGTMWNFVMNSELWILCCKELWSDLNWKCGSTSATLLSEASIIHLAQAWAVSEGNLIRGLANYVITRTSRTAVGRLEDEGKHNYIETWLGEVSIFVSPSTGLTCPQCQAGLK